MHEAVRQLLVARGAHRRPVAGLHGWAESLFDSLEHHRIAVAIYVGVATIGLASLFWTVIQADVRSQQQAQQSTKKMATKAFAVPDDLKLDPPKDDPISLEDLAQCNGTDPSKPILVAIKGQVFDVSAKKEMYGPGCGYNIFAGKGTWRRSPDPLTYSDGSRGLGKSSLKPEDAVADYSTLEESEMKVLDDWVKYFTKR